MVNSLNLVLYCNIHYLFSSLIKFEQHYRFVSVLFCLISVRACQVNDGLFVVLITGVFVMLKFIMAQS